MVSREVDEIGYGYGVEFELCGDGRGNGDGILLKGGD